MIPLLAAAPTIDGDLAEWSGIPAIVIAHTLRGHPTATASARIARVGDTLFVAVHVQDDRFLPGADHVELWLGEPGALDDEAVATDDLRDALSWAEEGDARQIQEILAARRMDRPEQHLEFGVSVTPTRTIPFDSRADLPSAVRIATDGWNAEITVPLQELRRVAALSLGQLAVRVDVVDSDPGLDTTAVLSNAPGRAIGRMPIYTLSEPVQLGSDRAWTDLGLTPPMFSPKEGAWIPVSAGTRWIAHGALPDSFAPTSPPTVEPLVGPTPLRLVDGARLDQQVGAAWTTLAAGARGVTASWHHSLLVVSTSEPENVDPMGMCGAAESTRTRVLQWTGAAFKELLLREGSMCNDPDHYPDCGVVGDRLVCALPDGTRECWRLGKLNLSVASCPAGGEPGD